MTTIAALCNLQAEQVFIREAIAELAIRHDWADAVIQFFSQAEAMQRNDETKAPDIVLCDVAIPGAAEAMIRFRSECPETMIIPIADAKTPPTEYVRPDIMPFGLLWRPLTRESIIKSLSDAFHRILELKLPAENCFMMKSRTGVQRVPYGSIYYFEAAEKKVFLRTQNAEYGFSGTLSAIEPTLPEQFLRCHKSYIVNHYHIRDIRYDIQSIRLDGDLEIPYSRGYRKTFLEKFYGRND